MRMVSVVRLGAEAAGTAAGLLSSPVSMKKPLTPENFENEAIAAGPAVSVDAEVVVLNVLDAHMPKLFEF